MGWDMHMGVLAIGLLWLLVSVFSGFKGVKGSGKGYMAIGYGYWLLVMGLVLDMDMDGHGWT